VHTAAKAWELRYSRLPLDTPLVIGVLNITPDSFSDGGKYLDPKLALARAREIADQGAAILEIGAESTRPGASAVTPEEEWRRLEAVLLEIDSLGIPVALDTRHPETVHRASKSRVEIINDVGGARDVGLISEVIAGGFGYVLMHSRGEPSSMMAHAQYRDANREALSEWLQASALVLNRGLPASKLCADPGFGFAKFPAHNRDIFRQLKTWADLGFPLMIGISRKRSLRELAGEDPERLQAAGIAAAVLAATQGAQLIRTHDIAATVAALKTFQNLTGRIENKDPL